MNRIVLASTSPYRKEQLEQLRIPFQTVPSQIDERSFKERIADPKELARTLSIAKAEAVAQLHPDAIVIGGDQVAEIQGELLDKPETEEGCHTQLKKLAGQTHHLWSGVAVVTPDACYADVVCNAMTMRALTDEEIRSYTKLDTPYDCVGSYRLESVGIALFTSIEGCDHTAIIGLPLIKLVDLLQKAGISTL